MKQPRAAALVATLALLAWPASARPAPARAATTTSLPYYLALGDSLAYGFQPNLHVFQGYADDLYARLRPQGARYLINMGCPDETLFTFTYGGCPFPHNWRKYPYHGPQLAAALAFLRAHPGQVGLVTIDIGLNDMLHLVDPATCTFTAPNVLVSLDEFDAGYNYMLSQLRTALSGTGQLLTMTFYFPYQNRCPNLLPIVKAYNERMVMDAWQNGVAIANVFAAFGGLRVPNPDLCIYTWLCTAYHDIHPTSLGYAIIAAALASVGGLPQSVRGDAGPALAMAGRRPAS